jgi:hypothetical protein
MMRKTIESAEKAHRRETKTVGAAGDAPKCALCSHMPFRAAIPPTLLFLVMVLIACTPPTPQATLPPVPTNTAPPTATTIPTQTPKAATSTAEPPSPTATPEPKPATPLGTPNRVVDVSVYFTDIERYAAAEEPYEAAVSRTVVLTSTLPEAVIHAFFKGPTEEEQAQGLAAITSGFTGLDRLEIEKGVAHVYLKGDCSSMGATYTIAQPLMINLKQFDEIQYVKIYDEEGVTEEPEGQSDSIPWCLEP